MPCGLQVFDTNGNLDLDTSTGIGKYLGEFNTGFDSGSFPHPELKNGRFWLVNKQFVIDDALHTYMERPKGGNPTPTEYFYDLDLPVIRFDYKTGTVSWTYTPDGTVETDTVSATMGFKLRRVSETYIYGVF